MYSKYAEKCTSIRAINTNSKSTAMISFSVFLNNKADWSRIVFRTINTLLHRFIVTVF